MDGVFARFSPDREELKDLSDNDLTIKKVDNGYQLEWMIIDGDNYGTIYLTLPALFITDFEAYYNQVKSEIEDNNRAAEATYAAWEKNNSEILNKEKETELENFMRSLPDDAMSSKKGSALLSRADLSIEEFKKLYREDVEKTTKEHKEFLAKLHKEEQEYNANFAKEQNEKKFKPMQVKKKYETYDINKDQKFLYVRELLNFKEKRGIDVLELMQKIDKKQILNKMA